jgi:hypothetical protein
MPALGTLAVVVLACAVAFRARLKVALVTVLAVAFLVPDTLIVPRQFIGTSQVPVVRAVILFFALGMVRRLARREMDFRDFRPRRMHLVLMAFVVVGFVDGVALGSPSIGLEASLHDWSIWVDQLVFFWSVLGAIRAIDDDLWVGKALGFVLVVTAGIAIGEHFDHSSYARWWFKGEPTLTDSGGAIPLELRGGGIRVRAADSFALSFGWVSAILFPVLLAVVPFVRSHWRPLLRIAPGAVVVAILWSQSRTPLVGLAGGVVALLVVSRFHPRLTPYLLVLIVLGCVAGLLTSVVTHPFSAGAQQSGSVGVRVARLPLIMGATAGRPYVGVGWTGLRTVGVNGTDSSYLTIYGTLGIIGSVVFLVMLATALFSAAGSVRAPSGAGRVLGAAAVAGVLTSLVAPVGYDMFTQEASTLALWMMVALGMAVGERARIPPPTQPYVGRWLLRAGAPVVGLVTGVLLSAFSPSHATAAYMFESLPLSRLPPNGVNLGFVGELLTNSVCDSLSAQPVPPGAKVFCRDDDPALGTGKVEVTSPTVSETEAVVRASVKSGNIVLGFTVHPVPGIQIGKPTGFRTAPVAGILVGLAVSLLVPPLRRKEGPWRRWRLVWPAPAAGL